MNEATPTTRAQQSFLRAFRQNPAGPAPADWPTPGVLRRWLRNRRFRKALTGVRDAIRFQTDLHLASAASTAARALQTTINPAATAADPEALADLSKTLRSLTDLLRLAHLRERYTTPRQPTRILRRRRAENTTATTPNVYHEILDDPDRLKNYMLLVAGRGSTAYDPFLAGFPEEFAAARANRDRDQNPITDAPTPDSTPTS